MPILAVFHPREIFLGWKHLLLGACKRIFNHPATLHLEQMNAPGYSVSYADSYNGQKLDCPICGFAMAAIQSADGWQLETCSAFPVARPGSATFETWFSILKSADLPEKTTTTSAAR